MTDKDSTTRFLDTIDWKELCQVASSLRGSIPSRLGQHVIGGAYPCLQATCKPTFNQTTASGYNIVQEIRFDDGVCWVARLPLPHLCYQPEECTRSYAATLRLLRVRTPLLVPTVFGVGLASDATNRVGVTYLLMERLPGRPMSAFHDSDSPRRPALSLLDRSTARKIHRQLAEVVLTLGRLP